MLQLETEEIIELTKISTPNYEGSDRINKALNLGKKAS